MIHLVCKRLQQTRLIVASARADGYLFTTSCAKPTLDGSNSIVSYLSNSCGLSSASAILLSKNIQLESTDQVDSVLDLLKSCGLKNTHIQSLITNRPLILKADPTKTLKPNIDLFSSLGFSGTNLMKLLCKDLHILETTDAYSVVELFRSYGFTETQITMLTLKCPRLYGFNAHKIIKPKLDYFRSLGIVDTEIAQMLSFQPSILQRSLENRIIPSIEVIRRIAGTDDNVLKALKACYEILVSNLDFLEQNIEVLINRGLPQSKVMKMFMLSPRPLLFKTSRFTEVVEEVEQLGFDQNTFSYILAIRTLAVMSKSLWERKMGALCSFGLSREQILSAFRLNPLIMMTSEKKIKKSMGFFLNELKLKPSIIVKNPAVLQYSLEKRIIPRCSVLQLLSSKDMINGDVRLLSALRMSEKVFLEKFVTKYLEDIPEVVKAYQAKIKLQGFPIELKT